MNLLIGLCVCALAATAAMAVTRMAYGLRGAVLLGWPSCAAIGYVLGKAFSA